VKENDRAAGGRGHADATGLLAVGGLDPKRFCMALHLAADASNPASRKKPAKRQKAIMH